MIKDLYPISKYPFEQFLIENNYSLEDNNTWKKFIHPNYCIHLEKKRKITKIIYMNLAEGKKYKEKNIVVDMLQKMKFLLINVIIMVVEKQLN